MSRLAVARKLKLKLKRLSAVGDGGKAYVCVSRLKEEGRTSTPFLFALFAVCIDSRLEE